MTLKKLFLAAAEEVAKGSKFGFVGLFALLCQDAEMIDEAHQKINLFATEGEYGLNFGWGYTSDPYHVDKKELMQCRILALCFAAAME